MEDDGLLIPILQKNDVIYQSITNNSNNDGTFTIIEDENKQLCNFYKLSKEMDMTNFDLTELLEQAPVGKAIISYYNNQNYLNDFFRNKLVDIIMRHLFLHHCKQYDNLY